ncbi:DUF6250 domain-containing protein [Roseateles cellulosilyticus]|uniref:DUF6250 domain-containing protein n=1 Tax=Pelomonas cellulosilytica TaxID=2906762 RepID=A0ABS8XQL8_9BURK|nr:DUF6250 domain-containing protein [Pelomonas sp. P8]MCE4552974.1 DUF6250 domain-containing protein [Pelomonas sp. P8]
MGTAVCLPFRGLIGGPIAALALTLPALALAWCEPPRALQRVAADDFRAGLARWRLEAEDVRAVVTATGGVLDIATPAGLTLWWREPLSGDYAVRFTAVALPAPPGAGALAGRLSDLNMFWNATDTDGQPPRERSGRFADYDSLQAYYVGFGANGNTTTRLRLYGDGRRELLAGLAEGTAAEPGEAPITPQARLHLARPMTVEIVSRAPTADDPVHLRWQLDGQPLFTRADPAPRLRGHFALRTTASRLQIRDFEVLQCR